MRNKNKALVALATLTLVGGCAGGGLFKGSKPKSALLGDRIAILTSESGVEVDPALADVAVTLPDAAL